MSATTIGAAALAGGLVGVSFLALWLDRNRARPLPWLLGLAAWGGGVPAVAGLLASAAGWPRPDLFLRERSPGAVAEAGAVVVLAVVLPLVVLGATRVVEGVVDAALFGLAAGAGVAVFLAALFPAEGTVTAVESALVTGLACAGAGATLGGGIGLGKLVLPSGRRAGGVLAAVLCGALQIVAFAAAAVSCHRAWPEARLACDLGLAAIALLALAAVLASAGRVERRVLARQLGEEVELGVLPAWTVQVVPSYGRRIRTDWWPRRDERREIARLLTALAFRKQQLLGLSAERLHLYALEVGRLRHRARALLALAPDAAGRGEAAE